MALNTQQDATRSVKQAVQVSRKNLNLMKTHPAMRLLLSLALPRESDPVRCGRVYGSDPTGAVKVFRKEDLRFPTNTLGDLDPSMHSMFLFRNPLRASIHTYGLNVGDSAQYRGLFKISMTNSPSYPEFVAPFTPVAGNQTPHGEALFLGRLGKSDPYRGILCSVTNILVFNVAATASATYPAGSKATLTIRNLQGSIWEPVVDATFLVSGGLAPFAYQIPETGYYAFDIAVDLPLNAGPIPSLLAGCFVDLLIQDPVNPAFAGVVWAQRCLPQMELVLTAIDAIRIIGVSGMWTNTASPLNRQGQITGLQVPKNLLFTQVMDQTVIQQLAKSCTIDVVEGMYGFLKPTSVTDLEMLMFEFASQPVDPVTEYVFDIFPASDYLALCSTVITPAGRQGYMTFSYSVEFETFSQWSELKVADVSAPHLDLALRALSAVPQWHTNEFHVSDVWNWIKDAAGAVWGGVKEVAGVAATVLPIAAAVL